MCQLIQFAGILFKGNNILLLIPQSFQLLFELGYRHIIFAVVSDVLLQNLLLLEVCLSFELNGRYAVMLVFGSPLIESDLSLEKFISWTVVLATDLICSHFDLVIIIFSKLPFIDLITTAPIFLTLKLIQEKK